jgi:tRNA nucleotidyltransferase/poly(A) polymerase
MGLEIQLTQVEQEIIRLLNDCVDYNKLNVTLRLAGGWVRDKVLGLYSDDMDVTVDTLTGLQMAKLFNEYLRDVAGHSVHKIGVISTNSEKSKHLETAVVTVLNVRVDMVNLRKEVYNSESRTPLVEFGTPEEDANSRDITINALYYNLKSGLIEDYTGHGLEDIKNRVIRTPLDPFETFTEDPLRILRCVRFSSRFRYQMDPSIMEAAKDIRIQNCLKRKISRERVGIEMKKMMSNTDYWIEHDRIEIGALESLKLLENLGVGYIVYYLPESICSSDLLTMKKVSESKRCEFYRLFENTVLPATLMYIPHILESEEKAFLLFNSMALLSFEDWSLLVIADSGRRTTLIHYICKNQLKMTNEQTNLCVKVVESVPLFTVLLETIPIVQEDSKC